MSSSGQPGHPGGSLLIPTLCTIAMLGILVGLGTWQLQRLAWKNGLLEAVRTRTTLAPVPPPPESEWGHLDRDALEYRRTILSGRFDHAVEVQVHTSLPDPKGPARGVGYWVLTPLKRDDGSVVIVNRGFVPDIAKAPQARAAGQVEGPVEVVGLARWSEERNSFTPADQPARGEWFTRDVAAIAAARGLTRVAPFYVDAEASPPGGLPQGGETRLAFPNRHFEYALTWYGLALGLVGVYVAFAWRRRTPPPA